MPTSPIGKTTQFRMNAVLVYAWGIVNGLGFD